VLRHRLFTNFNADAEGITPEKIVDRLLTTVPEPRPEDYRTPRARTAAPSEAIGEAVPSPSDEPQA
jgi:MoxR-like ATPase